jgi:ribonuclease E
VSRQPGSRWCRNAPKPPSLLQRSPHRKCANPHRSSPRRASRAGCPCRGCRAGSADRGRKRQGTCRRARSTAANGRALPKVQPFELPLADLAQIAEGSGLQWVNSDAERIAQARAAIAAEPKPVHVPRERPPVVVLDEGPLVLVETRRDLGSMSLPFEQAAADAQPQQRML